MTNDQYYLDVAKEITDPEECRNYARFALGLDLEDTVREQLEDVFVKSAIKIFENNSSYDYERACYFLHDTEASTLSKNSHKKIVRYLSKISGDDCVQAKRYAREKGINCRDILSPVIKKQVNRKITELTDYFAKILKDPYETVVTYVGFSRDYTKKRFVDYEIVLKQVGKLARHTSITKEECLTELIETYSCEPRLLADLHYGIGDYISSEKVARELGDAERQARALLKLKRKFESVEVLMKANELSRYMSREFSDLVKNLSAEQLKELRPLARETNNLEVLAQSYEGTITKHRILARPEIQKQRLKGGTIYELVRAHANGSISYLEDILARRLSTEVDFEARKMLYRKYTYRMKRLRENYYPGEGCPSEPPSSEDLSKANILERKRNTLFKDDPRIKNFPEHVGDPNRRAELYLQEGDVEQARSAYKDALRNAEREKNIEKAMELRAKIEDLSEE